MWDANDVRRLHQHQQAVLAQHLDDDQDDLLVQPGGGLASAAVLTIARVQTVQATTCTVRELDADDAMIGNPFTVRLFASGEVNAVTHHALEVNSDVGVFKNQHGQWCLAGVLRGSCP